MTKADKTVIGRSERANRRILMICAVMGGAIGFGSALIGDLQGAKTSVFDGALPRWFALTCVALWGLALPLLTWRWNRVVDEHERRAYYEGAAAGAQVMGVGAPVWWFLWRGGMAPPVDAFTLYVAFIAVSGGVWLWRKYV